MRRLILLLALAYVARLRAVHADARQARRATPTDAIVALTGGRGRIERGVALMQAQAARRMLVSGVPMGVTPKDLARVNSAPRAIFRCCIDLGNEAVDTRSNAGRDRAVGARTRL